MQIYCLYTFYSDGTLCIDEENAYTYPPLVYNVPNKYLVVSYDVYCVKMKGYCTEYKFDDSLEIISWHDNLKTAERTASKLRTKYTYIDIVTPTYTG